MKLNPGSRHPSARAFPRAIATHELHQLYHAVGTVGANQDQRDYLQYLVELYHDLCRYDPAFRPDGTFSPAAIFNDVEMKFGAPLYHVPAKRFAELVDYLHGRIDHTYLGKRNRAERTPSYQTFDEFLLERQAHERVAELLK